MDIVSPDHKLRTRDVRRDPGGGGLNVSRALRKLGGDSTAVYAAGGGSGDMLTELLTREGIHHQRVSIAATTRENLTVLEASSNREFRFVMPGAEMQECEWRQCLDTLLSMSPPPAYIVASGSIPPGVPSNFYGLLYERTRESGARVVVDTSGPTLVKTLEKGAFLVKPNLSELRVVTGRNVESEAEVRQAAHRIVDEGRAEVVVTSMSAGGAICVSRDVEERITNPIVPVRSTVGAGDSMVAGIVLSLARGMSVRDAGRFGVAAGAAAVMTPGTELCRREDAERFYAQMNP